MKNIANSGILARIRKLAPQSSERAAPFRTPEEWREWQLAEGRRSCEEIDRQNRQARAEKIFGRAGIQRLHRGCSFANYRIQNDGQRHALSQAKSIAGELDTGCTNFVFSGNDVWRAAEDNGVNYFYSPSLPGKGGKLWGSVSGREKRYFPFGTGFPALEAET